MLAHAITLATMLLTPAAAPVVLASPPGAPRAFDVITRKPGEGPATTDFQQLLAGMTANCDYSINNQWP